jgi:3-isopropylmalate/(R)-2-methylmalate dehydratase large subunit
MGLTITEKILARASGRLTVAPGEIVWADVDMAMMNDSSGPRRFAEALERFGGKVWDPDRVMVVSDHFVPAGGELEARITQLTREWSRQQGIEKFHEMEGIMHNIPVERAYVTPGILLIGADSHNCTPGAVGCLAIPVSSTDLLGVLVTGQIWLRVPETLRVTWEGQLSPGVMAKDMMLRMLADLGADGALYMTVEYTGEAVKSLPMDDRLTLTNMAIEMGAKTGIIEPDTLTLDYMRERGRTDFTPQYNDSDARFAREVTYDATNLEPMVALPYSPANGVPTSEVPDTPIDQAYIGACTGAKYHDIASAAAVLKGHRIHRSTRMFVAPATADALKLATADGTLSTLIEAGVTLLPPTCNACAGLSNGILAENERCISSTNRNFRGRMGPVSSEVYLASPATVAASAIAGRIADPRELVGV